MGRNKMKKTLDELLEEVKVFEQRTPNYFEREYVKYKVRQLNKPKIGSKHYIKDMKKAYKRILKRVKKLV